MRLNAQYGSMVRTSLSVHGRLMRIQALRQKRAAIDGAANEDARAQHIAERSMLPVVDPDTAPRQATSPEAAPAKLPAAAPAADVDQRTQKPVSENGINSQGAAFETSLSAQLPARGGVRTKNGTGLHEAVREAMAEPRSAGREPPPHLQHAATVAATQKRGDEAQLRPPALPTQTRQDRQNQEIWATAMAEVAGEYTTDLPNLLPAERKVASLRASALSSCANELLSGSAPGLDLPARRAAA
jgi:hypothetical protein